jgi:hypothetical protein
MLTSLTPTRVWVAAPPVKSRQTPRTPQHCQSVASPAAFLPRLAKALARSHGPRDTWHEEVEATMEPRRHIYRDELARPLGRHELAENKLTLLFADLGVQLGDDEAAVLALGQRHCSGLRRHGPKTRRYPSGPLRALLKAQEKPEDKLPLLMSQFGVTTHRECLLAAAKVHVPGFQRASPKRTGGRKRKIRLSSRLIIKNETAKLIKAGPREFALPANTPAGELKDRATTVATLHEERRVNAISDLAAAADEAWMCEILEHLKRVTGRKLDDLAFDLSMDAPEPGMFNPGYGLDASYIVERFKKRKQYDRAAYKRQQRLFRQLGERLRRR